ncbi:MAG: YsnF/AvaK domain-containing protein [Bdellovibrionia bacterium]
MISKNEALKKYPNLNEGLRVKTSDGDDVGKIIQLCDNFFVLEKGIFFPKDFTARYEDIRDIEEDGIHLYQTSDELSPWREEEYQGWAQTTDLEAGELIAQPSEEYTRRHVNVEAVEANEAKIPIVEEELQATKTLKEAGRLNIRKVVHTELKHFTIPVMREEVRIERGPAVEGAVSEGLTQGKDVFQEETISIPLREEEVTISKRPVVKEEVRIKKEQVFDQQEVQGQVKKEDLEIKEEGRIPKKKVG